jgi:hypothetical protein
MEANLSANLHLDKHVHKSGDTQYSADVATIGKGIKTCRHGNIIAKQSGWGPLKKWVEKLCAVCATENEIQIDQMKKTSAAESLAIPPTPPPQAASPVATVIEEDAEKLWEVLKDKSGVEGRTIKLANDNFPLAFKRVFKLKAIPDLTLLSKIVDLNGNGEVTSSEFATTPGRRQERA